MNIYGLLYDSLIEALDVNIPEEDIAKAFTSALNDAKKDKAASDHEEAVALWYNENLDTLNDAIDTCTGHLGLEDAARYAAMAICDAHSDWSVEKLEQYQKEAWDNLKALERKYTEGSKEAPKMNVTVFKNGQKVEEKELDPLDPYQVLREWVKEINRT